jgi:hypothetical protein
MHGQQNVKKCSSFINLSSVPGLFTLASIFTNAVILTEKPAPPTDILIGGPQPNSV